MAQSRRQILITIQALRITVAVARLLGSRHVHLQWEASGPKDIGGGQGRGNRDLRTD